MKPHKVILDSDLAESLWRLPARSRREIVSIFEKLADYRWRRWRIKSAPRTVA